MPHAAGLWYEWHGPEDGEVLILSPGLGGSASYWEPNLAALAERYRVLVYDHGGTGRSGPLPERVTVAGMAEDVFALMLELRVERPTFIGHALGGLIGLELEFAHFELARLVIINGWDALDPHTARCFDVRLELLRKSGPEAYVQAQPIFLYPSDWISNHSERLAEDAVHQLANFPPVSTVERRIAAARNFKLRDPEQGDDLCPTLLICSADDILVPSRCSRDLRAALPSATLEVMPWGGHACNVTCPDQFNQIVIAWLGAGDSEGVH